MGVGGYPSDVLEKEEPRYLRRQKPVEIKRRKFNRRALRTYLRGSFWFVVLALALGIVGAGIHYIFFSPRFLLVHPSQVSISGNTYVPATSILEIFAPDHGHSLLRIPLSERRRQVEAIPWVRQAVVRRTLPDRISVEIQERSPVAWLRLDTNLSLIDADGVILDRPLQGSFHFPAVTGLTAEMPQADRGDRIRMMLDFLQQIDLAHPGSSNRVSEVDLSDGADVRATFARLADLDPAAAGDTRQDGAVVIQFGDRDFQDKFRMLLENLEQWRVSVGKIEAVDMRFGREAVVNPQTASVSAPASQDVAVSPPLQAEAKKH
jgi:cell division protein FtsQ